MNLPLAKSPAIRSPALMRWARDNPHGCQIRYPGWCQWNPTCGSHMPSGVRFGKGTANKPHDLIALGCQPCHDIADYRIKTDLDPEFIRLAWLEGFVATMVLAIQDGLIEVAR